MNKTTYNEYVKEYSSMDGQELLDRYMIIKASLALKGIDLTKLDKQSRKVIVKTAKKQAKANKQTYTRLITHIKGNKAWNILPPTKQN